MCIFMYVIHISNLHSNTEVCNLYNQNQILIRAQLFLEPSIVSNSSVRFKLVYLPPN